MKETFFVGKIPKDCSRCYSCYFLLQKPVRILSIKIWGDSTKCTFSVKLATLSVHRVF